MKIIYSAFFLAAIEKVMMELWKGEFLKKPEITCFNWSKRLYFKYWYVDSVPESLVHLWWCSINRDGMLGLLSSYNGKNGMIKYHKVRLKISQELHPLL